MAVRITKLPSPRPANIRMARASDNNYASIKATWGIPADAYGDTNHGRWNDAIDTIWAFYASKNMSGKTVQQRGDGHATGDRIWVRDKGKHSTVTIYYNRAKYHPLTKGRYLRKVVCNVRTGNAKGHVHTPCTFTFKPPRAPSIAAGALDSNTSRVTFKVTTDEGRDAYERYDTRVRILRRDSANRNNSYKKEKVWAAERSTTAKSYSISADVGDALSIIPGQWVRLRCVAYARGCAGQSKQVVRDYYHAYPALAKIGKITCTNRSASGVVRVPFSMTVTATAPVDTVRLQRLTDTALATASSTSGAEGWEDVDNATDNGNARGFVDSVGDARPSAGNHTWYRIKTVHGSLVRYSTPVEVTALYHKYDEGGSVKFATMTQAADGTSIVMRMAWATDNYTGVEVAWSDNPDAWESNEGPTTYKVDWEDSSPQVSGYAHSARFVLAGLDSDKPVYIRARRYAETDGVETHSTWSNPKSAWWPIRPVAEPAEVTLTAPQSVVEGEGIQLTWSVSGDADQTAYKVMRVNGTTKTQLVGASGSAGTATVPADMLDGLDSVAVYVSVTCGGSWTDSETKTVNIRERPVLQAMLPAPITAQPAALTLACTDPTASVVATLVAHGMASGGVPAGERTQAEGDAVWSDAWTPTDWAETTWGATDWYAAVVTVARTNADALSQVEGADTEGTDAWSEWYAAEQEALALESAHVSTDTVYTSSVDLPASVELIDGATYDLTATATADALASEDATWQSAVAWAHQATAPEDTSTVVVDSDALSATITPVASYEAISTDVCDVWRVTTDGAYQIATDVEFGTSILDPYAPFAASEDAGLAYRLVTRTADGDVDWIDVPYALVHRALRIDWDGRSIELPYNIRSTDARSKGFELSERWDGSRQGHWDAGNTHKASFGVELVKLDAWDDRRLLADLGSYAGSCLVRTPNGQCMAANVDVPNKDDSYGSAAVTVSLDVTEHEMGEEYMARPVEEE